MDPDQGEKSDPDPHPHQIEIQIQIRIRIRINVMRIHNTGKKSGKNRTTGDGAYCTLRLALIPWGGSLVYLIDICRRPRGKQELISVVIHSRKPGHM